METFKRETIRTILKKPYDPKLAQELVNQDAISGQMRKQWDSVSSEEGPERVDYLKIWKGIKEQLWCNRTKQTLSWYKRFSVAASILILFGVVGAIYLLQNEHSPAKIYIVSTGKQDTQIITMSDGTTVKLGSASMLTYPEKFTDSTRTIQLVGQAFFDVAPNPDKPFVVDGISMTVRALGTSFELFSHQGVSTEETILLTGKVKIDFKHIAKSAILSPNEKLAYNRSDSSVNFEYVDADKYSRWRNSKGLSFENENLMMILPRLESWFNTKIQCDEHIAKKYRFTFEVRHETIEQTMSFLSKASKLSVKQVDKDYVLYDPESN